MRLLLMSLLFGWSWTAAMAAPPEVRPQGNVWVLTVTIDRHEELNVAVLTHQINGRLAICGLVWPGEKSKNLALARKDDVLRDTVVRVGKQLVQGQFSVFRSFNSLEEAENGMATCTVTNLPWKAQYATDKIDLKLRTGRFRG